MGDFGRWVNTTRLLCPLSLSRGLSYSWVKRGAICPPSSAFLSSTFLFTEHRCTNIPACSNQEQEQDNSVPLGEKAISYNLLPLSICTYSSNLNLCLSGPLAPGLYFSRNEGFTAALVPHAITSRAARSQPLHIYSTSTRSFRLLCVWWWGDPVFPPQRTSIRQCKMVEVALPGASGQVDISR